MVPILTWLSAQTRPLWASTILRTITSPRPVLDSPEVVFTLIFGNGLKSLSISVAGIPCPLMLASNYNDLTVHIIHLLHSSINYTKVLSGISVNIDNVI